MNTIKALIEFFTHLSKGNQFIIIGLMALPFLMFPLGATDSMKMLFIVTSGLFILIGQGIDYFYPQQPPEKPPAREDCDAHVIIRKDTGIIVDSYSGGPFDTNMAYLKQTMRDGDFMQHYCVLSFSKNSKFTNGELSSLIGVHADVAFASYVNREGFVTHWARKAQ